MPPTPPEDDDATRIYRPYGSPPPDTPAPDSTPPAPPPAPDPFAPPASDPFAPAAQSASAPDPFAPPAPDPFAPPAQGASVPDPFAPSAPDPFAPPPASASAPDPFAPAAQSASASDPFAPLAVDPFAPPSAPAPAPPPVSDPFAPVVPPAPAAPQTPTADPFAPPPPGAFNGAAPAASPAPAPDPFATPDPFAAGGAPGAPDPFDLGPRRASAPARSAPALALPNGTGRLADAFSGVFALILHLRASSDFGDPSTLRQRAEALLDQAVARARSGGNDPADVREAEFCLVAFLDETVLTSEWAGRDGWAAKPLQLSRYERYDAGEAFFDRLRDLLNGSPRDEVLEVYYLCIALGYKGRYQIHGREVLGQLVDDLQGRLSRAPGGTVRPLSANAIPPGPRATAATGGIPTWAFFAGAAALVLLLYLALSLSVSGIANDVASDVQALAPSGQTR